MLGAKRGRPARPGGYEQSRRRPRRDGDNLPAISLGTNHPVNAINVATYHTCAIFNGGLLKCWGRNMFCELGQGDTNNRGDAPGQMGDNLAFVAP
jgi:hypothetical protein